MRLVENVTLVGLAKELHPVMFHTIPSLCASYLMCQLAVDLHYPETAFEAVLPHVHPSPDCALDMSDLGVMLHLHLLLHLHSQNKHCATLAVGEVHRFGYAWSPQ
jgi:hypothetical protein